MIEVSVYYPVGKFTVDKNGNLTAPEKDRVKIEFILPKRPFFFWADVRLGEWIQYPRGYGAAYYNVETARILMAPMPFNVLIGFVIWCYHWTRYGAVYWLYKHRPDKPK